MSSYLASGGAGLTTGRRFETREEAARDFFDAFPSRRSCTTRDALGGPVKYHKRPIVPESFANAVQPGPGDTAASLIQQAAADIERCRYSAPVIERIMRDLVQRVREGRL